MGTIGYTYGSEWQLLRLLGYHRDHLNQAIEASLPGARVVRWLDLGFRRDTGLPDPGCYSQPSDVSGRRPRPRRLDREHLAINFLSPDELTRVGGSWANYWPQTGSPPNWDAVAQVEIGGTTYWLLVEAKSHLREVISFCGAKGTALDMILAAFTTTIERIGAHTQANDWLGPYYQFCNRLAVLSFLLEHKIPAKLLFVYFLGDVFPAGQQQILPIEQQGWMPLLQAIENHVGWTNTGQNALNGHVHKLFLPVCPPGPA